MKKIFQVPKQMLNASSIGHDGKNIISSINLLNILNKTKFYKVEI